MTGKAKDVKELCKLLLKQWKFIIVILWALWLPVYYQDMINQLRTECDKCKMCGTVGYQNWDYWGGNYSWLQNSSNLTGEANTLPT